MRVVRMMVMSLSLFRMRSGFVINLTGLSVLRVLMCCVSRMFVMVVMFCVHCAVFGFSYLFVFVHNSLSSL